MEFTCKGCGATLSASAEKCKKCGTIVLHKPVTPPILAPISSATSTTAPASASPTTSNPTRNTEEYRKELLNQIQKSLKPAKHHGFHVDAHEVIGLVIGLLVFAIISPIALSQVTKVTAVNSPQSTAWTGGVSTVFAVLLPIIIILGVVTFVFRTQDSY